MDTDTSIANATRQFEADSPVIELRQYTLHPGGFSVLAPLFEAEFIAPQEAIGIKVIGTFADIDDPTRFVWLRGFPDMAHRASSLAAFYGGESWRANRERANATMVDSDNVLLLQPAVAGAAPKLIKRTVKAPDPARGVVALTTLNLAKETSYTEAIEFFEREVAPRIAKMPATLLAYLISDESPNNFPGLPIREGERVLCWLVGFESAQDLNQSEIMTVGRDAHRGLASPAPLEFRRLNPTPTSLLTGRSRGCQTRA